jgi:hypothetical protein
MQLEGIVHCCVHVVVGVPCPTSTPIKKTIDSIILGTEGRFRDRFKKRREWDECGWADDLAANLHACARACRRAGQGRQRWIRRQV